MENYNAGGQFGQLAHDNVGYKVQLFVSCRKLKDVDGIGQGVSDPVCIIYQKQSQEQAGWTEFGRSEQIMDNLNPDF